MNLTNHSYWNLSDKATMLDHTLQVNADCVTDVDEGLIPTGEYLAVDGTPLDLRAPKKIGDGVARRKECRLIDAVDGYACVRRVWEDGELISERVITGEE